MTTSWLPSGLVLSTRLIVVLAVWPYPPAMCHLIHNKRLVSKIDYTNGKGNLRVADHEFEVIVSIDAGAEILVVVLKLLNGDDLVTLVRFPHGHEVGEHLIGRLFTALEVGVEAHIIGHSDVINGHLTAAILIKDTVGLVDHIETASVELTSDSAQKFVKGKLSVLVAVEVLHNLCHLDLR